MPETKELGRLYVHGWSYPDNGEAEWPRFEPAVTHETEYPYRTGTGLVIRLFGRHGFAVGWWGDPAEDEDEHLMNSLRGSELEADSTEITGWMQTEYLSALLREGRVVRLMGRRRSNYQEA